VQLLSASSSASDSWLPLLCWDREAAAKLPLLVERIQIEPHPVSGEIELQDVEDVEFRRLDNETLHCRFHLDEFELLPTYLWCTGDVDGWKLSELRTAEDKDDGSQWFSSVEEANEHAGAHGPQSRNDSLVARANGTNGYGVAAVQPVKEDDDDDDDAYWAAYDRTPGRTPAKRSPAPVHKPSSSVQMPSASELEYFARYVSEVQPAMDPHDPSEQQPAPGESTLNGNTLRLPDTREIQHEPAETTNLGPSGYDSPLPLTNGNLERKAAEHDDNIVHPRPTSPSASSSGSVAKLERQAAAHVHAEVGIKQHISTDLKSLYRLAKSAGIERAEFERIVRTELDMLSMMDMDH
jgi:hypothetical protein